MPNVIDSSVMETKAASPNGLDRPKPKYPGVPVTCNGNQLVAQYVETRVTDGGIFYPITPSTEGGEIYQGSYAAGELNVFGGSKIAIECEGEHAAQGGATAFAFSLCTPNSTLHTSPPCSTCAFQSQPITTPTTLHLT